MVNDVNNSTEVNEKLLAAKKYVGDASIQLIHTQELLNFKEFGINTIKRTSHITTKQFSGYNPYWFLYELHLDEIEDEADYI